MRHPGDRGSATVWTVGAIGVIFVVVFGVVAVESATLARHRATSAADLGALAAATAASAGESDACAKARWVVRGSHAVLDRCVLRGWESFVEVSVSSSGVLGVLGSAHGKARAGPVDVAEREGDAESW